MTAKVLKPNGQLLHVSTYRPLSDDEMQDPGEKRKREQYDSMLRMKLGKPLLVADLEELGIHTPEYELCEEDNEGGHQHAEDAEDLVTNKTGDQYIGAEVSLCQRTVNYTPGRSFGANAMILGTSSARPIRTLYLIRGHTRYSSRMGKSHPMQQTSSWKI